MVRIRLLGVFLNIDSMQFKGFMLFFHDGCESLERERERVERERVAMASSCNFEASW